MASSAYWLRMRSPSNNLRRARPLLGTIVDIRADAEAAQAAQAIEAAFAVVEQIHHLMSFHETNSDVSRINSANAHCAVRIAPRTYQVLAFARRLGDLSDGAFDIAVADILVKDGFLPDSKMGSVPVGTATYRDLDLLPDNCVRWHQNGWIDLGGIAKGYAVDCAVATLQSHGIRHGVVNAGGDLRCFGEAESIHVRQPNSPTALMHLGWLRDCAVATSGGYFSGAGEQGHRIDPLIDPRLRVSTTWNESVSVVAGSCMTADALTKVVRLAPEAAPYLLEHFSAQAVVINQVGMRTCGASLLQQEAAA